MRRWLVPSATLLVAVSLLDACSGGASTDPSASGAIQVVKVTVANSGCPPDPAAVLAGPVEFDLRNPGSDVVGEVELLQGTRIVGEKEDLEAGLSGTFVATLDAGTRIGMGVPSGPKTVDESAGQDYVGSSIL